MTRIIRLAAEYVAHPLWERTPGREPGDIDPSTLPISDELVHELASWNGDYQDIARNDFEFQSHQDESLSKSRGRELAARLAHELGAAFSIEYDDD